MRLWFLEKLASTPVVTAEPREIQVAIRCRSPKLVRLHAQSIHFSGWHKAVTMSRLPARADKERNGRKKTGERHSAQRLLRLFWIGIPFSFGLSWIGKDGAFPVARSARTIYISWFDRSPKHALTRTVATVSRRPPPGTL
jgi:hypothetical protein